MSRAVAIGDQPDLMGFALVGVDVVPAATADDVRSAWDSLPPDVAVVMLAPFAARVLAAALQAPDAPLTVVIPS